MRVASLGGGVLPDAGREGGRLVLAVGRRALRSARGEPTTHGGASRRGRCDLHARYASADSHPGGGRGARHGTLGPSSTRVDAPAEARGLRAADLPYGWDTLLENIADPSHIPFAHHGLQARLRTQA